MPISETRRGEIYIFLEAFIWGFFPVITIFTYSHLGPLFTAGVCSLIASGFFAVLMAIRSRWSEMLIRSAWPDVLKTTLILAIGFYALMFTALKYSSAGNVAIVGLMEVFFSFLLLGTLVRHEAHTKLQYAGALCMVLGAVIVLLPRSDILNIGDGFMLLGAAIAPFGNMYAQRARKCISAETLMFLRGLIGGLVLLLGALFTEDLPGSEDIQSSAVFLLINGVVMLGITKWLWVESLHRLTIGKAISLTSVSPLFTLVFAYFFLHETITFEQVAGVPFMLLGVHLLTRN